MLKVKIGLAAGRRMVAEIEAQQRIKRRVAEAARRKADTCECLLCVARRTGDPFQMMAAIAELATASQEPHTAAPHATH